MEKRTEKTEKGEEMNNINNSTKIEMLCELAHNRVKEECENDSWETYMIKNVGEGQYTEYGQVIFNEWYDYYDSIILTYLKEKK